MTAHGELYANENCRDVFEKKIDKVFGKGTWSLDGSEWSDCWDTCTLPDVMRIPIVDNDCDDRRQIGELVVINKFFVEDNGHGRYVEVEPKSAKVIKNVRKPR